MKTFKFWGKLDAVIVGKSIFFSVLFFCLFWIRKENSTFRCSISSHCLLLYTKHLPLHLYSCILILVNQRWIHSCLYQLQILSVQVCIHMEVKIQAFYKYNSNILWESTIWNSSGLESTQLYSILLTVLTSFLTLPLFSPQLTARWLFV